MATMPSRRLQTSLSWTQAAAASHARGCSNRLSSNAPIAAKTIETTEMLFGVTLRRASQLPSALAHADDRAAIGRRARFCSDGGIGPLPGLVPTWYIEKLA